MKTFCGTYDPGGGSGLERYSYSPYYCFFWVVIEATEMGVEATEIDIEASEMMFGDEHPYSKIHSR